MDCSTSYRKSEDDIVNSPDTIRAEFVFVANAISSREAQQRRDLPS